MIDPTYDMAALSTLAGHAVILDDLGVRLKTSTPASSEVNEALRQLVDALREASEIIWRHANDDRHVSNDVLLIASSMLRSAPSLAEVLIPGGARASSKPPKI